MESTLPKISGLNVNFYGALSLVDELVVFEATLAKYVLSLANELCLKVTRKIPFVRLCVHLLEAKIKRICFSGKNTGRQVSGLIHGIS